MSHTPLQISASEDESEAYCAGWNAHGDGSDFTTGNPYPFLSNDYHDWQRGWTDSQEEQANTYNEAFEPRIERAAKSRLYRIERTILLEEIAEWHALRQVTVPQFFGWASMLLFDEIRSRLKQLNGLAGEW